MLGKQTLEAASHKEPWTRAGVRILAASQAEQEMLFVLGALFFAAAVSSLGIVVLEQEWAEGKALILLANFLDFFLVSGILERSSGYHTTSNTDWLCLESSKTITLALQILCMLENCIVKIFLERTTQD